MNPGKQRKRLEKALRLIHQVDTAVVKARTERRAQSPPPDPYMSYVAKAAAGGSAAAREELGRMDGPGDWELREHAARVLKTAQSGEARRLAQVTLDRLDSEAQDRLTRDALAKQGRPR